MHGGWAHRGCEVWTVGVGEGEENEFGEDMGMWITSCEEVG